MSSRNPPAPLRDPAPAAGSNAILRLDFLTGAFLFLATAAFVFWQNTHLTVLWDLSYILENATRISLGQLPYRDFPFPYAPLTFLTQAAIIKLFGRAVLHHYLYASAAAGCATLLTWRILLRLLRQLAAARAPHRLSALSAAHLSRHQQHLSPSLLRLRLHPLHPLLPLAAPAPGIP